MNIKDTYYKITHWESWHYLVKYIPIMPVWLYYCIKARSFWFFTPSNPTLTFGGFEGESKKEMYDQLPPGSYPRSIYISSDISFDAVQKKVAANKLTFPLAVKPDIGMMGFMFRKINTSDELQWYHQKMKVEYIIQELITYPLEVSVFYYRMPGDKNGTVSGFLKKEHLQVIGDGRATLWELIQSYDRVRFRQEEMRSKHVAQLERIIPKGEPYFLSYALNLSRGGKLVSLAAEIDEKLVKVFDGISHYTRQFYYGRYDIKCKSIELLKEGKEFSILEYNGCGAEPHHAYGNGHTLLQAYGIFLHHWKILYKISRHNHNSGIRQWEFTRGKEFLSGAKKHFRGLRALDIATRMD